MLVDYVAKGGKKIELSWVTELALDNLPEFRAWYNGNGSVAQYTGNYGSKEYSANHPGVEGHDAVKVKGAKLSSDGRTVRIELPDLKPVQQFKVKYDLESAEGEAVRGEAFGTIHELRK